MPERTQLQEDAFFRPPTKIGRYELRPLSAASFVLLRRLNNPIATVGAVDIDSAEGMVAALTFVYIHANPIAEVLRLAKDPEALEEAVLIFSDSFPIDAITIAVQAITGQLSEATAAMSEPAPPKEEDESPNGRRRPGSRTASLASQPKQVGRATR